MALVDTSHKNANKDDWKRCVLPFDPSLSAFLIPPCPPRIVFRVLGRPRRQKLPCGRRKTVDRSEMQRGISILRHALEIRQLPPFSAQVHACPPVPAPSSIYHDSTGVQPRAISQRGTHSGHFLAEETKRHAPDENLQNTRFVSLENGIMGQCITPTHGEGVTV